jgi:hypothetical protein
VLDFQPIRGGTEERLKHSLLAPVKAGVTRGADFDRICIYLCLLGGSEPFRGSGDKDRGVFWNRQGFFRFFCLNNDFEGFFFPWGREAFGAARVNNRTKQTVFGENTHKKSLTLGHQKQAWV